VGPDYGGRLRAFGYGSPAPLPDGKLACISSRGNYIATAGGPEGSYQPLPGGLGDLAPLPDGRLLATVLRPATRRMNSDVIGVIDPADNRLVQVYESPAGSVHSPVYLGPRPRPPVIPDQVDPRRTGRPESTGFLNCHNVRFTRNTKADWQQVRAIRVLGALALTTRSSHSHIVHAGHQTVELGTVPLAPDGSFSIEVPADLPIAFQAVDAEGRSELNEMSWIYVRPGERRSCLGCHHPRGATPPLESRVSQALSARPLKLVGQGQPHRFRGNNSGVTGMMDLQFERFREAASLNRHLSGAGPLTTGRQEVDAQIGLLRGVDEAMRISAAQRLGVFRDRSAAPALAERLTDDNREVRVAAALALAACGTRESVPPLLGALEDKDPVVAQAAAAALENLAAHAEPFQPFAAKAERSRQAQAWRAWFQANRWESIEQSLIQRIAGSDRVAERRAIVALGHVGGDAARAALRQYVIARKDKSPYPPFENANRTDSFTYPADSPLNPRTLQEAVRAIGQLKDTAAVPLLADILAKNIDPKTANLYLAEAAIEALGRIATPEAETALIDTFGKLKDYWDYVGWYSDHPALYACHSSPVHARIIETLDATGSTRTAPIVPHLIRSVPTDPDRALFPANDDYETLVGRVLRRSGRSEAIIETCLALLGDSQAAGSGDPRRAGGDPRRAGGDPRRAGGDARRTVPSADDLKQALEAAFGAWAGQPAPDNRAAQILSLVCRDNKYESRIRAAYERYRSKPEDPIQRPLGNPSWIPQRHWVLFFLGRTLGNLGSRASVDTLLASLKPELNEARHGRPDPSEPNIHFLQLEYTPCWRATAAWALGQIGERRSGPTLLSVIGDLRNATDVRHAAAEALGRLADPASLATAKTLAEEYPEHSVRRALLRAVNGTGPVLKQ
jgi:HEAT repeat protein